jgi:hypothetical protein
MAEHKTRESIADHVANVKTKNGAVYHARQAEKDAQSELNAYLMLDTRKAEREVELHEAAVKATETVNAKVAAWVAAKDGLAKAREALVAAKDRRSVAYAAGDTAGVDAAQREIAALEAEPDDERKPSKATTTRPSDLAKLNEMLTAFVAGAHWTPAVKRSLVDWLDSRYDFHKPAGLTPEQVALVASHDAVDSLPVDESTKAMIRAGMPARPTLATTTPPVWGVLPPKVTSEASVTTDADGEPKTTTSAAIIAQHAAERESLATQVKAALEANTPAPTTSKGAARREAAKNA